MIEGFDHCFIEDSVVANSNEDGLEEGAAKYISKALNLGVQGRIGTIVSCERCGTIFEVSKIGAASLWSAMACETQADLSAKNPGDWVISLNLDRVDELS